jgi:hypothetical protein
MPGGFSHPEEGGSIGILKFVGIRWIHLDKSLLARSYTLKLAAVII